LLVVGNDKAVCISTVALKHCREICLILRGAAEDPILTTFQTDQYAEPIPRCADGVGGLLCDGEQGRVVLRQRAPWGYQ